MDKLKDPRDTETTIEPPLTNNELEKWNAKLEKTLKKNFKYSTGIELDLTPIETIRWVRSRIRKEVPSQISEERLENCRILLRKGNSVYNISKTMKIGYQKVTQLRAEMKNQEQNA